MRDERKAGDNVNQKGAPSGQTHSAIARSMSRLPSQQFRAKSLMHGLTELTGRASRAAFQAGREVGRVGESLGQRGKKKEENDRGRFRGKRETGLVKRLTVHNFS